MALWKVLLGAAVVGGGAAVLLSRDDDNKLPGGGSGKDGAEDEPGHLTPDEPPRPKPPLPDLDATKGWGPNVHLLSTPEQFEAWAILDVMEQKPTQAAKGSVYFGYSRTWDGWQAELDKLRGLSAHNDDVRFIVFDFDDSRVAIGQPQDPYAYAATAVGPNGEPREHAPLIAKKMDAKNIPAGRWARLVGWARNGPEDVSDAGHTGLGGQAMPGEAPPSSGNYGPNATSRYLPDHPRGPHWVVVICDEEQLPDQSVTRCRWYIWKGKHATTLAQADYSSSDKGKPWSGASASRAGAFAKAIDFIDDYQESAANWA